MEDSGHWEDREGKCLIPEVISGGRRRQPAVAKRRFPARRLHLVDIENLAGDSLPSLRQVRQAKGLYAGCLGFGAMDQVEVAWIERLISEAAVRLHGVENANIDTAIHYTAANFFTQTLANVYVNPRMGNL